MRTPVCDAFKFFRGRSAEGAMSFVEICAELFETLNLLASQQGYVFQSDYLGLAFATPVPWKNVDRNIATQ